MRGSRSVRSSLYLRMNPSTLVWYLPLLVRDIPGALQPSESAESLQNSDSENSEDDHSAVRLHPFSNGRGRPAANAKAASAAVVAQKVKAKAVQEATWEELDAKFRRDLPNDSYLERLAYRGLVMRACPKAIIIDGVRVGSGEREKAEQYLEGVLKAKQQAAGR